MAQHRRHNAIEWSKKQWDTAVEEAVQKYEKFAGSDEVDIDELRDVLTELNSGRPPMLRDLMWAMHEGDRDGGGTLSKHEFRGILSKFRLHMKSEGGIVSIVQRYTDKHGELSDDNMRRVIMEVTSAPEDFITADDILRVRKLGGGQKEVIQNFNLLDKTGPSQTMQINVDHLARAIDRWADERDLVTELMNKHKTEASAAAVTAAAASMIPGQGGEGSSGGGSSIFADWFGPMVCCREEREKRQVSLFPGVAERRLGTYEGGNSARMRTGATDPFADGFVRPYYVEQSKSFRTPRSTGVSTPRSGYPQGGIRI
eukprot:Tamp_20984.p1 GENE.Tamp_20984~~Tamp_20984.p1  ORF type:complete len:314 (-),score=41.82 Tamp_20984:226-1167(-)